MVQPCKCMVVVDLGGKQASTLAVVGGMGEEEEA